jgi:hypothetical protein
MEQGLDGGQLVCVQSVAGAGKLALIVANGGPDRVLHVVVSLLATAKPAHCEARIRQGNRSTAAGSHLRQRHA